ncbi:MAG: anaerobic ribonucleoside-triphosphate reductase activating protein [Clostridia bacterium]|nr:anaerobic ribonucleoside-triphosphate reductase activating protein [Clostridia bacterium]
MIIGGFQKMSMVDFPEKIACTVFTYGCNFRCPFCHNAGLVTQEVSQIPLCEILSYLDKRKGILDGVCISGGEPLIQEGSFELMEEIKSRGLSVKLDTNGYLPEKLEKAIELGLVDYVAMDIKNSKEKYAKTVGLDRIDISKIEKSVSLLLQGRVEYEFRTTAVKELHSAEDFKSIGEWIKGAERYYIQAFVDSGNIIGSGLSCPDITELNAFKDAVSPYVGAVELRGV